MHTPNYGSNATHTGSTPRGVVSHAPYASPFNSYLPAMDDAPYAGWWSERFARRAARTDKRAARICGKKPDSGRCARKTRRAEKRHAKHAEKMGIPYLPGGGEGDMLYDEPFESGMGALGAPNPIAIVGGLAVVLGAVLFLTRKKG